MCRPGAVRQTERMRLVTRVVAVVGGVVLVAALVLALAGGEPTTAAWVLIGPAPFYLVGVWLLRRRPDRLAGMWLLFGGVTFLINVAAGDILLPMVRDEPWAWIPSIGRLLADNIGLAAPEHLADTEAVAAMAARSGLLEHLGNLPEGLGTSLAHGSAGAVDLSGGQWQRLAIARAMFAVGCGRQVLVLDEPTAHLDVRAEAAFYDQIVRDIAGVSIVLISHRLSTVRHADRIVLLQDGRITESGSHAELIARGGEYARLFELQAARFADVAEDA